MTLISIKIDIKRVNACNANYEHERRKVQAIPQFIIAKVQVDSKKELTHTHIGDWFIVHLALIAYFLFTLGTLFSAVLYCLVNAKNDICDAAEKRDKRNY